MKKTLFATGLLSILLTSLASCGESAPATPVDTDELPMSFETATDYEIVDSSNKDGSMHYEVFVRSFYDSNKNGIGDLNGLKEKLPYLADMGYRSLWLMPIMPSPTYHGYDVTDYFAVNKEFGTLEDFDALVAEAKKYNIDIILDLVLNHCSIKHPYFTSSYEDYIAGKEGEESKADWFNWGPGGQNKYKDVFYESRFGADMPDFNLDSKGVRKEIDKIVKFWIQHGVKGFRLDAVLYYYYNDTVQNIAFLDWLEDLCHSYDPNFYMVGECWQGDGALNPYFASKLDSYFRFGNATGGDSNFINMIKGYTRCDLIAENIEANEASRAKSNPNSYSSYFLSNHDQDRIAKNFQTDEVYKAACSLYTLLPGVSYTYYGEEIAMKGTRKTGLNDDLSDARRRLPMIWSENDKTGQCVFPEASRPELAANDQVKKGVLDQLEEPFSLIKHYKMMIHLRNKYPWIKRATFTSLCDDLKTDERSVMAYRLSHGSDSLIVVHNFASHNVEVEALGDTILHQINTSHRIPTIKDGKLRLGAFSSVILK